MASKNVITRELHESIRNILGRSVKTAFRCMTKLETKPDKYENRVLVFSSCRMFIFTSKVPTKLEHTFHYLEIQGVESKKPHQLCLTTENKVFNFNAINTEVEVINHIIIQLGTALKTIFPQVPLDHIIRKFEVDPSSRLQGMLEYNQSLESKDPGPCGGFSTQYACMCDYHSSLYREEVAWDVDTIYLSHDSKELSLLDFDHLDGRDLVPIISALSHNAWFTKFRASNMKLIPEALEQILVVMKKTVAIEELYLDNIGVKSDFAHKLALSLISNPNVPFHTLDLSNNLIEDKGINYLNGIIAKIRQGAGHLSTTVGKLQRGLIHLNLSRIGLSAKGVNSLSHALSLNKAMPSTLTHLNLSENIFKEDINNLYNFLAQPNALAHLDLSGTECALDMVFGALLRGCTQNLNSLNLSRNLFSLKKAKDIIVPPSFKAFFSSTLALKKLNVSNNRLPLEALKAMLLGLASNEIATDVALDLSCNDLRSQGALVLESCLPGIRCLCHLDISENNFDADLANVILAAGKNKSLKHLYVGRNFSTIKPKHLGRVLDAIVQLIHEEDSALETLSLAESKLRSETCIILNALGSNQSLTSLDITGNLMGPAGAKTLAKALQINTKLRSIFLDKNNITVQGFVDLAYALDKNFTLRYMPCPITDATAAMKVNPEKTESALKKIEELLCRNVNPQKCSNGQAFRLQQGFLFSSMQQMVDRRMVHLQDTVTLVKRATIEEEEDEELEKESYDKGEKKSRLDDQVNRAELYLKDANSSKQLLTRLHDVVLQQEVAGVNPVELKLQDYADDLNATIINYIKVTANCMVECLKEHCPTIMSDEHLQQDIEHLCRQREVFSSDVVKQAVVERAGADVMNKVSETNLSVAAHLSDRILDEVIDCLTKSHRELADGMNQQRSATPDVLRGRSRIFMTGGNVSNDIIGNSGLRNSRSRDSQLDRDSFSESSDSPSATPKLAHKRRSVHTRKLRPQSVVDSIEGIAADDIPDLLPKESEDSLPSLSPTSDKLEHLGKNRPKRPKTRAPTRPCLQSREIREDLQELGEGLDKFFKKPPITSSTSASPDSEDIRGRTNSNSTTASDTLSITSLGGSRHTSSIEKVTETVTERKGIIRGIASFFSRTTSAAKDESAIQKSQSCDPVVKVINSSEPSSISESESVPSQKQERGNSVFYPSYTTASNAAEKFLSPPRLEIQNGHLVLEGVKEDDIGNKTPASSPKMEKVGVGVAPGNVLAEMKARQEKRSGSTSVQQVSSTTTITKTEEKTQSSSSETNNLLKGVRLKPTGLAEALKSPTDYAMGNTKDSPSSLQNFTDSSPTYFGDRNSPLRSSAGIAPLSSGRLSGSPATSSTSPGGSPRLGEISKFFGGMKVKPPPLVPPKPRPRSVVGGMVDSRLSGEFTMNLEDADSKVKSTDCIESVAHSKETTTRIRSTLYSSEASTKAGSVKSTVVEKPNDNFASGRWSSSTSVGVSWSKEISTVSQTVTATVTTNEPDDESNNADVVDV